MKWIIILILLLILLALIAARYRRQIRTGIEIWKMFRQLKTQVKPKKERQIEENETEKNALLVRCARCGAWTSQTSALKLRSKTFYCSTVCMEKAVKV